MEKECYRERVTLAQIEVLHAEVTRYTLKFSYIVDAWQRLVVSGDGTVHNHCIVYGGSQNGRM